MLHEVLAGKEQHFVMDISSKMDDESLFDSRNELNGFSKVRMWEEINQQLERFDKHKLSLKPFNTARLHTADKDRGDSESSQRSTHKSCRNRHGHKNDRR